MALLLLGVSVGEISAGPNGDLQTGGVAAVGQSQLQLSVHADALQQAAVYAEDAAAAALRTFKYTTCSILPLRTFKYTTCSILPLGVSGLHDTLNIAVSC